MILKIAKVALIALASYAALGLSLLSCLHFTPALIAGFSPYHEIQARPLTAYQRWYNFQVGQPISALQAWYEVKTMDHISKDSIVGRVAGYKPLVFPKSLSALDDCRHVVHLFGGGLCEVVDPKPGMYFAYPNQDIPAKPRDARICRIGKTCPKEL